MKNLFTFAIASVLVLSSLVLSHSVSAAAKEASPEMKGTVVAEVTIKSAKIVFQDGKTFKISFSIENGEGIQTGVKYGVKLFSKNPLYLADEKVYDESLTLHENTTVNRELSYTVPAGLSGTYTLVLDAKNESNFPFGQFIVDEIKLTSSVKGVMIMPESCFLSIKDEKDARHYSLSQNLEVTYPQALMLNCTATNMSSAAIRTMPMFEIRSFGSFGPIVDGVSAPGEAISFAKNEKKTFSIPVPKVDVARGYNTKFWLAADEGASNSVFFNHILGGEVSATIQSLSLDKESYKSGDTALVSFIWFGAGISAADPGISAKVSIVDGKGWECVNPITQLVTKDPAQPMTVLSVAVKSVCENPHVTLMLLGPSGKTLDQKEFIFKSGDVVNGIIPRAANRVYIIIGLVALLIITAVAVYGVRRKKANSSV